MNKYMENLNIREAQKTDILNLTVLKQQVWISTYAVDGIRTEFSEYVLSVFTPDNIEKSLSDKNMVTFIAENDNHMIGCVDISFSTKCPNEIVDAPEVTVLYVLERFCGQGIGKQLLDKVVEYLKSEGHQALWLTVYHDNKRAINFYNKLGFKDKGVDYFEMDGNKYENRVMVLGF